MDDQTCMVDVARYFIDFLTEESCGKCIPCREGLRCSLDVLDAHHRGQGRRRATSTLLEEMGGVMQDACLCALGSSAPNPVLSTLRYFRDEYDAHIRDHRCPAGVCKALIHYEIDQAEVRRVPCLRHGLLDRGHHRPGRSYPHLLNQDLCIKCGACVDACKREAVLRA
ncbi:MAG: 4Fe-4S binding protein [Desulfobacterales bacterium]|nr:4Fe-4S binding protein [Desulfobacterales bacterium]